MVIELLIELVPKHISFGVCFGVGRLLTNCGGDDDGESHFIYKLVATDQQTQNASVCLSANISSLRKTMKFLVGFDP